MLLLNKNSSACIHRPKEMYEQEFTMEKGIYLLGWASVWRTGELVLPMVTDKSLYRAKTVIHRKLEVWGHVWNWLVKNEVRSVNRDFRSWGWLRSPSVQFHGDVARGSFCFGSWNIIKSMILSSAYWYLDPYSGSGHCFLLPKGVSKC